MERIASPRLSPTLGIRIHPNTLYTIVLLHTHIEALTLDTNAAVKSHEVPKCRSTFGIVPIVCHIEGRLAICREILKTQLSSDVLRGIQRMQSFQNFLPAFFANMSAPAATSARTTEAVPLEAAQ